MIPREILKKIRQIEIPPKLRGILCIAIVSGGCLLGCASHRTPLQPAAKQGGGSGESGPAEFLTKEESRSDSELRTAMRHEITLIGKFDREHKDGELRLIKYKDGNYLNLQIEFGSFQNSKCFKNDKLKVWLIGTGGDYIPAASGAVYDSWAGSYWGMGMPPPHTHGSWIFPIHKGAQGVLTIHAGVTNRYCIAPEVISEWNRILSKEAI